MVHKDFNFNITWDHSDPSFRGAAVVRVGGQWYGASFGSLQGGQWYHLAMTYDGETLKAYRNGKLITQNTTPFGSPDTDVNPLTIGKHNSANNYFAGMIDEVRIWDVVKTEAEITANMYREIGTNSNLKVYYKMNDGTGTTTSDNSANGNTATFQGAPLWRASGAFAGPGKTLTYSYNSTTDRVETPLSLSTALSNKQKITIAGYIRTTTLYDYQTIFSIREDAGYKSSIIISSLSGNETGGPNDFWVSLGNGTGIDYYGATESDALQTVWTHIALVFDGTLTGDAQRLKFYVNGVQENLHFYDDANFPATGVVPSTTFNHTYYGTIGCYDYDLSWEGNLDEMSFWTTALTPAQIREIMCRSLSGSETNLQAYYRFDEGSGTTAYDHSINGRDATLGTLTFDANSVASTAFNTWIGGVNSSASNGTNWSSGVTPDQKNVGIYKWPGGNGMTMDFGPTLYNTFIAADSDPSMASNFTVGGNCFVNDDLDLAGGVIHLGQKGYLFEGTGRIFGATGRIQGYFYTIPSTSVYTDFQNTGFSISSPSTLLDIEISRYHGVKSNDWGTSILRNYSVSQSAKKDGSPQMDPSGGGNPGVRFTYNDQELNGIPENNLLLAYSSDNGVNWTTYPGTVNTSENTVTVNEVPSVIGLWTLTNSSSPLPVELASFTSSVNGKIVTLNWETKTEVMNHGFEVERQITGSDWQKTGFVEGHGTSNSPKYYTFTDQPNASGKILYRLKQIDTDGGFEYSPEISVEMGLPAEFALHQNYPNPFNPETVIGYALPVAGEVTLEVYNSIGEKMVTLVRATQEAGNHQVTLRADNLPSGLYFYKLNVIGVKNFASVKKFVFVK